MLPAYVRNVYFPYALGKPRIFLDDHTYYDTSKTEIYLL